METAPPCKGLTELFFAPPGERDGGRLEREECAKAYCAVCPDEIRSACLAAALRRREPGVWGGTNEADRRLILRNRQKASA